MQPDPKPGSASTPSPKRSKKWLLLLLFPVALLLLLAGSYVLFRSGPGHAITRDNFDRIQNGMTQPDIEAIFEAPPGNYASRPVVWIEYAAAFDDSVSQREWITDEGRYEVFFNQQGKVVGRDYRSVSPPDKNWLQAFWQRLWE
jgi:hypothetical protein